MKLLCLSLLAISIAATVHAQVKSDLEDMKLKGKIKSLKTTETHRYRGRRLYGMGEGLHPREYI